MPQVGSKDPPPQIPFGAIFPIFWYAVHHDLLIKSVHGTNLVRPLLDSHREVKVTMWSIWAKYDNNFGVPVVHFLRVRQGRSHETIQ